VQLYKATNSDMAVLLNKLGVAQLIKKFPNIYGT
jgi:hypothetical protein